jgi:hypothetical protein
MKTGVFASLLVGFMLTSAGRCGAIKWPASCGAQAVKFDVRTETRHQPLPAPPPGKSEIVFLEDENQMIGPFMYATVRFGVDGAWVGADKGASYFSVDVVPGVHHLCASWQSDLHQFNRNVDLTSFTAIPGTIYYFSAIVRPVSRYEVEFRIKHLNQDLARYRMGSAKFARSRVK